MIDKIFNVATDIKAFIPDAIGGSPDVDGVITDNFEDVDFDQVLDKLSASDVRQLFDGMNHSQTELVHNEFACKILAAASTSSSTPTCAPSWDTIFCWPSTPANSLAVLPCFEEFNGIQYDNSENATRWCWPNGTWSIYSNYTACKDMRFPTIEEPGVNSTELNSSIYFFGYTLSLIALVIAISIFLYFKDLRCLRNTIHMNLMFTYILTDFMWILTLTLQLYVQNDITWWWCVLLIILLHYFVLTNFFWMFVEGLYLYMLVVETFYAENLKLKIYAAIGWGGPIIFVISWVLAKSFTITTPHGGESIVASNFAVAKNEGNEFRNSPWMTPHPIDWIFKAPALTAIAINIIFLGMIMWVLITKLRSATNAETQQYRKATKALVVLIPLLGTTYILVISGIDESVSKDVFIVIDALRAILISTQGFTVALFYCFLNTEVQNTVRHYFNRWRESRSLKGGRRYRDHSKDWSPRSRTESIRLCLNPPTKRESSASESTTTTMVGSSGAGVTMNGGRMSNGSGHDFDNVGVKSPFLAPPGSE